jgi:hypothetical protein
MEKAVSREVKFRRARGIWRCQISTGAKQGLSGQFEAGGAALRALRLEAEEISQQKYSSCASNL